MGMSASGTVLAQEILALKLQTELIEVRPDDTKALPAFMTADHIEGTSDGDTTLTGSAEIRKSGTVLKADKVIYNAPSDEVNATSNVRVTREGILMTGPELKMKVGSYEGYFLQPSYFLKDFGGRGVADRADFDGVERLKLQNPNYTTCPVPGVETADWYLKAESLELDTATETGTAKDGRVYFKQVPILAAPSMSFPLSDKRKSGFLSPSIGATSRGGAEVLIPYYVDIAPNKDLVINAKEISKRGFQYGGQFRYLEPSYFGEVRFERVEKDLELNRSRFSMLAVNTYNNNKGLYGAWNINKVSDDQYFVDFSRTLAAASQRTLPRDIFLGYAQPDYNILTRVTRYQTLQDPSAPVVVPYDRVPQLLFNGQKLDILGADFNLTAEASGFSHPTLVQGQRLMARPSVSYPLLTPAFSLTPRLTLQGVTYNLNTVADNVNTKPSSAVPIASLDAKVTFERPAEFFGKSFLQTLEPRLYYLYAPYREQGQQPLFDTGLTDFNFAQIFSENRFGGYDRVGDANQVTAAAISRLIDENTGIERLRLAVGQRYNFTQPKLVLPGQAATDTHLSDFLFAATGFVNNYVTLDSAVQVDADSKRLSRSNFGVRYKPGLGRLFNVNYRYTRDALNQFDVSAQWPLTAKFSGVGRINYSVQESRLIESLAGLEYNDGCWAVRGYVSQFATATGQSNTSLFVQLELSGLGRIGSNPQNLLRRNIPGYSLSNYTTGNPSRFTDYE